MSEYFGLIHHSVWSVITAHNLTPAKRDVTNVVSDQLQNVTVDNTADLQRLKRGIQIRRPKKKKMTPASRHASRAMMPEHTRSYNLCAPLATASAYTAMGFSLRRSATTTRTTASTSTSSSSSSTVVQLRQTQQQLTPRRPSVTVSQFSPSFHSYHFSARFILALPFIFCLLYTSDAADE